MKFRDIFKKKIKAKPEVAVSQARYYDISAVAANLDEKRPFFKMNRGVYAVQTNEKGEPTNFIRVSKKRGLVGKARKKARQADRALVRSRMNMTPAQKEVEANG